jgi:hypothetical protein
MTFIVSSYFIEVVGNEDVDLEMPKIFFRLQTLGIRVLKEPQPLQMQHRIKQTPLASTVDRRAIMLTVALADVNHPPQL